tara:strand:- start:10906 stop:11409 length:504 start_codon:yes stop_codon:yes gene_type:complete
MLAAGAERAFKPVLDGLVSSLCGWLSLLGLALCALFVLPPWVNGGAMILASLYLALAGLARYVSDPGPSSRTHPAPGLSALPWQQMRSPESWAVAIFLAGSALSGSLTLAAAFAGLTLLAALGLCLWALAGWSGCLHLRSDWHRRHLDWGFGILLFVAAMASLIPEA